MYSIGGASRVSLARQTTVEPEFLWARLHTAGAVPDPVCCHTACAYQDRYIITFGGGGRSANNRGADTCNLVHCLDLETSVWRSIPTVNSEIVPPRIAHSAVIHKDRMLVYGGHPLTSEPISFSQLFELDLLTWTWRLLQDVPSDPEGPGERYMHSATVYKGRMYVLMGVTSDPGTLVWYLDLIDYSWHAVPQSGSYCAPNIPLVGHSVCLDGDQLYIFGGETRARGTDPWSSQDRPADAFAGHDVIHYSSTLYRYSLETNEWAIPFSTGPVNPPGRYASAMGMLGGRLYLFGGDCDRSCVYFDDFWTLDTRAARPCWREVGTSMRHGPTDRERPSKRTGAASAILRGAWYVLGGETGPEDPQTAEYQYSNEVYRRPLVAASRTAPLRDSAARWLSRVSLNTLSAATLFPALPIAPRTLLASYLPNSEAFFRAANDPLGSTSSNSSFDGSATTYPGNEEEEEEGALGGTRSSCANAGDPCIRRSADLSSSVN